MRNYVIIFEGQIIVWCNSLEEAENYIRDSLSPEANKWQIASLHFL